MIQQILSVFIRHLINLLFIVVGFNSAKNGQSVFYPLISYCIIYSVLILIEMTIKTFSNRKES